MKHIPSQTVIYFVPHGVESKAEQKTRREKEKAFLLGLAEMNGFRVDVYFIKRQVFGPLVAFGFNISLPPNCNSCARLIRLEQPRLDSFCDENEDPQLARYGLTQSRGAFFFNYLMELMKLGPFKPNTA
jgi:hypothetical protein